MVNNNIFCKMINYYKEYGIMRFFKRVGEKVTKSDQVNYQKWLIKHLPSNEDLKRQRLEKFVYSPKFSIVVPLFNTPEKYLHELIKSVLCQSYEKWELILSDGSGNNSGLYGYLNEIAGEEKKINFIDNKETLNISENTNRAMKTATGDYIVFVDHDDLLTADALYECAKAINVDISREVLYSDEDKITMDGSEYFQPHFKPDFNKDLLCSMNYICHLFVVKSTIIKKIGYLQSIYNGAQDYDFVLRSIEVAKSIYHIPKILYHWRAHKESTAENPESKLYAFEAGRRAIEAHYKRSGITATVKQGEYLGLYRTRYEWDLKPLVSIIIPNKDHSADLKKCISSIERKALYQNYEYIIVENGSVERSTFLYYDELRRNPKVKIVVWKEGFNYSAINNFGAKVAQGEYFLFLNNDTEMINDNCLEELLGYAMREDVGVVGARLYYEDNTIQHAGVIIGFGGIAGHAFLGLPGTANGYFSRILCAQDLSAVTAACMMVKRHVFELVEGFDETLKVAFNDIDFCMKAIKVGYLVVYNPYAELFHYESKSRGQEDTQEKIERFNSEIQRFAEKWPDILKNGDPYYNPNLSMKKCDFTPKRWNE